MDDFELFADGILSQPLPDKGDLWKEVDAAVDEEGIDPHAYAVALLRATRRQTVEILRQYRRFQETGEFSF